MNKMIFGFLLLLASCNSDSNNEKKTESSAEVKPASTWAPEEDNEFLASCVENAKSRLDETAAFAHCNCVLGKLKQDFPNMDSATTALLDSSRAAAYVNQCK